MSQTTLGDEDLFGEAAAEVRSDVEAHLEGARAELPDADAVWETDADNVLGVLNGLRSALDVGEAEERLRQAKKWYTMGERADAFEDADDLAADIEAVEELVERIAEAREQVGELTSTMPELRSQLQEAQEAAAAEDDEDEAEDDD
ncbi:MAG: DUF5790 family protein [Haloferacaceae archaeon]